VVSSCDLSTDIQPEATLEIMVRQHLVSSSLGPMWANILSDSPNISRITGFRSAHWISSLCLCM
jgi:hypothetical protein